LTRLTASLGSFSVDKSNFVSSPGIVGMKKGTLTTFGGSRGLFRSCKTKSQISDKILKIKEKRKNASE